MCTLRGYYKMKVLIWIWKAVMWDIEIFLVQKSRLKTEKPR